MISIKYLFTFLALFPIQSFADLIIDDAVKIENILSQNDELNKNVKTLTRQIEKRAAIESDVTLHPEREVIVRFATPTFSTQATPFCKISFVFSLFVADPRDADSLWGLTSPEVFGSRVNQQTCSDAMANYR